MVTTGRGRVLSKGYIGQVKAVESGRGVSADLD